jgi:hypothetical protein
MLNWSLVSYLRGYYGLDKLSDNQLTDAAAQLTIWTPGSPLPKPDDLPSFKALVKLQKACPSPIQEEAHRNKTDLAALSAAIDKVLIERNNFNAFS